VSTPRVDATVPAPISAVSKGRFLDTVLASIAQGVCVVDRDLTVQLTNDHFLDMFGFPSSYRLSGRPMADYVYWSVSRWIEDESERWDAVREVLDRFSLLPEERYEETWPDGRVVELWRKPLPDGGFVTTYTDVTDRAEAEVELIRARNVANEANRAKSEFLAIMSHELRTPLNAVIGFSEIMLTEMFGPLGHERYTEYTTDIHDSGKHLLELINDILDVAKIDVGKLAIRRQPINLRKLVKQEAGLLEPQASEAGLTLVTEFSEDLPELCADKTRLRQILINLMSNAIKFTAPGGSITVSARRADSDAISLSVADTGIGMSPRDVLLALEPFGQIQSAMSRNHSGTGLGLTIVKRLAEMHGGQLAIDSVEGRGTTVTVTLPLTPPEGEAGK